MTYLDAITVFHTALCFAAIGSGVVAVAGLFKDGAYPDWTNWFLVLAIAVSVTGYFFPFRVLTPAIIVGAIALAILALALLARYRFRFAGRWRRIYAAGLVASLYLLVFVGIAHAFQKIDLLHRLAPTGSEPPFAGAQAAALLLFLIIGWRAAVRFQPSEMPPRSEATREFAL